MERWRGEEEAFIRSVSCQTSQQLLPCLPNIFFSSAKSAFFPGNVRSRILRQFPEGKVQEVTNVCGSLQGMMRLESREVQAEGLVKVFFTHNHGSTGFGGCMVVGSGVSRSYQGPGPPFPHPTPFILLMWIPPLTFIVRRAVEC